MRMPTILKILLGNKKAACGLAIVVAFVLMALFAPILASNEPTKRVARPHQPPSAEFVMGSTRMGHDIWAQFTNGARISLLVPVSRCWWASAQACWSAPWPSPSASPPATLAVWWMNASPS